MDKRPLSGILLALLCGLCLGHSGMAQEKRWETPFGTRTPQDGALHGKVYRLPVNTRRLPDFETLHPVGDLYTYSLWVKTQTTFPWRGLPSSEWYAIDYRATFWLKDATRMKLFLLSDDGSKLYIDDRCVIDNDGVHSTYTKGVRVRLSPGLHRIRVSYFQGPAPYIALALGVQFPGQELRAFDVRDFSPPSGEQTPALLQRPQ